MLLTLLIVLTLLGAGMVAYAHHRGKTAPPEGDLRELVFGLMGMIILGPSLAAWILIASFFLTGYL